MAPPPTPFINAQAVSGITGSISACWIIVFAPQIYQNFVRKSAEGLSLLFVILWLLGDIFNVIGAIKQGVLPTMIILAIYYTLADIVLLWQCLYYGHGTKKVDPIHLSPANPLNSEIEPLMESVLSHENHHHNHRHHEVDNEAAMEVIMENDVTSDHPTSYNDINGSNPDNSDDCSSVSSSVSIKGSEFIYNFIMVSLVFIAGFGGWYFGDSRNDPSIPNMTMIMNSMLLHKHLAGCVPFYTLVPEYLKFYSISKENHVTVYHSYFSYLHVLVTSLTWYQFYPFLLVKIIY